MSYYYFICYLDYDLACAPVKAGTIGSTSTIKKCLCGTIDYKLCKLLKNQSKHDPNTKNKIILYMFDMVDT